MVCLALRLPVVISLILHLLSNALWLSMSAQLFSTHIFWLNNCCIDFVPIALYLYGCICIFFKTAATFWLLISTGQIDASLEQGVEAMRTLILGGFTNKITRFNLGQKYKYHKVWIQEKGIAEREAKTISVKLRASDIWAKRCSFL